MVWPGFLLGWGGAGWSTLARTATHTSNLASTNTTLGFCAICGISLPLSVPQFPHLLHQLLAHRAFPPNRIKSHALSLAQSLSDVEQFPLATLQSWHYSHSRLLAFPEDCQRAVPLQWCSRRCSLHPEHAQLTSPPPPHPFDPLAL